MCENKARVSPCRQMKLHVGLARTPWRFPAALTPVEAGQESMWGGERERKITKREEDKIRGKKGGMRREMKK